MVRRPLRWELAPAEALRLVRDDAHPVALFGTWAGRRRRGRGRAGPRASAAPVRWRTSSTGRCHSPPTMVPPPRPPPSPTLPPSAAAGSGTWATARAARRSPRPDRAGCPRGGSAGTTTCWCATGRRGSGSSRRCGHAARAAALERRFADLVARAADAGAARRLPRSRRSGSTPGAAGHQQAVARAVEYIRAGDIFQANICLRAEAEFVGDPLDAFCQAAAELRPPYAAFIGVSATPAKRRRRCVPARDPRRRGVALARAVPAPGRPDGHVQADQGHRPPRRRRGRGGRAAGRARAVGQEPVGERDDRRPGPQRPQPRLRPGHGHGPRPARRRAPSRRVAPGLDRRGHARPTASPTAT